MSSQKTLLRSKAARVGTKQTLRALQERNVARVFLAQDAEERVIKEIRALAEEMGITIEYVPTMQELGQACGIEVGAAAAAILGSGEE